MTPSAAAHRLVSTLPLQSLPDLVGSASFASPCHDDEGRDLVFSALRNPDWKTARAHKEAAQSALLAWLSRKDVDPFAPQLLRSPTSKAKKGAPKEKAYASSFQLALELGLEPLVIGMLSSASPDRLAVLRASEQGRQVLEVALAKNMVGLVKQAAASGWEVRRLDAQGRSLLWQARSVDAIRTLLDAGVSAGRLDEPGLVEALRKFLPKKDAQPWLELVGRHSSSTSLVAQKLSTLLEDIRLSTPETLWNRHANSLVKNLTVQRQRLQRFLTSSRSDLSRTRVSVARGLFKGELTAVGVLAHFGKHNPLRPAVSGLLRGMEEQVFSGPAQEVRPGVTDMGLLALFSPPLSELDNQLQNAMETAEQTWWTECLEGQRAIQSLHSPEQWHRWKMETAATLSKKPNTELLSALGDWMSDMSFRLSESDESVSEIRQLLSELEEALSNGVAFVSTGGADDVESWLQWVNPTDVADYDDLMAQRDRVMVAILGNQARYASSMQAWGRSPSQAWSPTDHFTNPFTLFSAQSLDKIWSNPQLATQIKRGLEKALELNAPNTPGLKQALLEGRLKPAQPASTPRPRL